MRIAIASGKGGTGKTTVAVSLALSLAENGNAAPPLLVDCDVEAPNAGLFLAPAIDEHRDSRSARSRRRSKKMRSLPSMRRGMCLQRSRGRRRTGTCISGDVPRLRKLRTQLPHRRHSEVPDVKGSLERGRARELDFAQGTLKVGVAMPVPAIRQLKKWTLPGTRNGRPVIIDAPPGTSCPVVETMRDADFVLLVTEPTPFGLHDLRMAVEVARGELGLPVGVVINRDGIGDQGVEKLLSGRESTGPDAHPQRSADRRSLFPGDPPRRCTTGVS